MTENQEINSNVQTPQNNTQSFANNYNNSTPSIPSAYKPLSPWAYVGYNLLFSIPLLGFIMMIVFSFDSSNINRKNYARSFFCAMLIGIIISIVLAIIIFGIAGVSYTALSNY